MNKKHVWVIVLITLSYVFTYFVPIILMYFALRESFVTEYVTQSKYSLSFLGFVTVAGGLMLFLLIKLSIQLRKAKASIFKHIMFGTIHVLVVLFVVFVLIKMRNYTYVIEEETVTFFTDFRSFLNQFRNYLFIFAGCLTASSLANIAAILIDKKYVQSLDWL